MNKISKWWIASGAALIVVAGLGVGAVMAQEDTPTATTPDASPTAESGTPQSQETPDAAATPDSGTPDDDDGDGDGDGDGEHRSGCGVKGVSADELAGFLGISVDELRAELAADGATLATVAAAHGQDRAALIAFLTEQTQSALDERVAAGDLTQAEADEKLADFTANVDSIVDSSGLGHGHGCAATAATERRAANSTRMRRRGGSSDPPLLSHAKVPFRP